MSGFVCFQKEFTLTFGGGECKWGSEEVLQQVPEIKDIRCGTVHLFMKHTSSSVSVNESYDRNVWKDMSTILNNFAPKNDNYAHSMEGSDDMPAHAKTALMGSDVTIPITDGKLNLGNWQGIWFCEHRAHKHTRNIVVTVMGAK